MILNFLNKIRKFFYKTKDEKFMDNVVNFMKVQNEVIKKYPLTTVTPLNNYFNTIKNINNETKSSKKENQKNFWKDIERELSLDEF